MARKDTEICIAENCNGSFYAKELCSRHYKQVQKHGRTLTEEEISESRRQNRLKGSGSLGKKWKIKDTSNMKGRPAPKTAFVKGHTPWNKGTEGLVKAWNRGIKTGIPAWNKGLYGYNSGENNPNWKGGVHTENNRIRRTKQYKAWRTAVFERDDYTCQFCDEKGVYLEADHIKPFAFFPELRFEIDNGRTLCKECHMKTPTYKNHKYEEILL